MKSLLRKILGPSLSLILFTAAIWLLHGELKTYHLSDILKAIESIPAGRMWLAIVLTIVSYAIMTGYDVLAMRYIQYALPYSKIGLASFIGYAFSNNIGMSMIAGASVRYRLYSAWGLSALQTTQVVAFCTLTLWLGFCVLGGAVFLIEPLTIPSTLHLPIHSSLLIGVIMLMLVAAYATLTIIKEPPSRFANWKFSFLPSACWSCNSSLRRWTGCWQAWFFLCCWTPEARYPIRLFWRSFCWRSWPD